MIQDCDHNDAMTANEVTNVEKEAVRGETPLFPSSSPFCRNVKCDLSIHVQGDHSDCFKPPVNTKTNVAFYYMLLILKQNFCFRFNERFQRT